MNEGYIVQTFSRQGTGTKSKLITGSPLLCNTREEALNRAERFSHTKDGVVAISQMYDPTTGEYGDVKIFFKYGDIPNDMSEDE